ncbi:MAG TPA: protein kinase [Gemmatimonadaceae bacterium]|nr:protein kinase [Gemmatimonadaceae bacterium]
MTSDDSAELVPLFDELIELEPAARDARLRELGPESSVSREVVSLLAAAERAGDFLGLLNGAPPAAGAERAPSDRVGGRYRLERHIGSGAMGDVHLAWDEQLERQVALKFLRAPASGADPASVARFRAEARAAARIDHPHVGTVYDAGETASRELFIVMAYYPGQTLRERIARGPLPHTDALRIAAQIAGALAAAHAAGIVHRDVKPANVLFDAEGGARLTDFGIAKLLSDADATTIGVAMGTPAYMSPEQSRGAPVHAGTDLWALGVMLHEMLFGTRPRGSGDVSAAGDDAAAEPARALIAALLTEDPAHRPSGAKAVQHALEAMLADADPAAPARAMDAGRGALPHAVTSLVGRRHELAIARALLRKTRLLTLTGPGGTGKTRLSLELGDQLRGEYADGVWFVPLAEISEPGLVPSSVAQALGVRDLGATPVRDRVINTLRARSLLLVLDNFEHVLDAAPFVSAVLASCPGVTMLVTSRASLGVQGEQVLPVPPLATPRTADDVAENESVQLFLARARAVRPSFVVDDDALGAIADVCRRLDGLPLALELAAARMQVLAPRAILSRLERRLELLQVSGPDRPARHGTMRAVIDWSYVLLTDEERALFRRLAVFAGGASLEAAEAAASEVVPRVLDGLESLVSKSLLQSEEQPDGDPRFTMLETVREFGLEQLSTSDDDAAARRAHRSYFIALAERGAAQLRGPDQAAWLDRLEREHANLRLALDDALGDDRGLRDAARLSVALHRVWLTRGPLLEGIDYLRRVLDAMDAPGAQPSDAMSRARVTSSMAHLVATRSLFREARDLFARSLTLYRAADDRAAIAATLNNLAWQVWIVGDLAEGEALSREAMAIHAELRDELGVMLSRSNLAWIAMERGDFDVAEQHFEAVIASHERRGEARAAAFAMSSLGELAARRGDHARAVALHERALRVGDPVADLGYRTLVLVRLAASRHELAHPGDHFASIEREHVPALREFGRLWPLAYALNKLGELLLARGDAGRARAVLEEALDARITAGVAAGQAETRLLLGVARLRAGDRVGAATQIAEGIAAARTYGARPILIAGIEAAAELALDAGTTDLAATLLASAERARNADGAGTSLDDASAAAASVAEQVVREAALAARSGATP